MGYNFSEQRALRSGLVIIQDRRNGDTGEMYSVQIKVSWNKMYYSCDGDNWHRTAKAARLAARTDNPP
jgi:hypothetical protein